MDGCEFWVVGDGGGRKRFSGNFDEEYGEGFEGVVFGEEGGGEGGLGGGALIGETFEYCHLVYHFVDDRDVGFSGEADPGEEWVVSREVHVGFRGSGWQWWWCCGGHLSLPLLTSAVFYVLDS